jgi:hypothetical protein
MNSLGSNKFVPLGTISHKPMFYSDGQLGFLINTKEHVLWNKTQ